MIVEPFIRRATKQLALPFFPNEYTKRPHENTVKWWLSEVKRWDLRIKPTLLTP